MVDASDLIGLSSDELVFQAKHAIRSMQRCHSELDAIVSELEGRGDLTDAMATTWYAACKYVDKVKEMKPTPPPEGSL